MLDQLSAENSRDSVRFTVPVDEMARRRFEAMVAEHRPAMYARARELCRSHFDADDLVHDALVRAMRTTAALHDPARARSWLLRIVTTTFIDWVRRQRRQPLQVEVNDEVPAQTPDPPSPWDHITQDDVRAAAERLPDDVRDTYRMFAIEGLDHKAISAAQQVAQATVGTRIHRARRLLRAMLTGSPVRTRGEGPR